MSIGSINSRALRLKQGQQCLMCKFEIFDWESYGMVSKTAENTYMSARISLHTGKRRLARGRRKYGNKRTMLEAWITVTANLVVRPSQAGSRQSSRPTKTRDETRATNSATVSFSLISCHSVMDQYRRVSTVSLSTRTSAISEKQPQGIVCLV